MLIVLEGAHAFSVSTFGELNIFHIMDIHLCASARISARLKAKISSSQSLFHSALSASEPACGSITSRNFAV